jgi:hypothetical protein
VLESWLSWTLCVRFSSFLSENIVCVHYKVQSAKAMNGNAVFMFIAHCLGIFLKKVQVVHIVTKRAISCR